MNEKEMHRRLRRTLVEAACLSDDAIGFRRVLDNWARSDVWLKAALSDRALLGKVSGDLIRMLQSVRPKRSRPNPQKLAAEVEPTPVKPRRRQRSRDVPQNLH